MATSSSTSPPPLLEEGDFFSSLNEAQHAITELGVFHGFSAGVKKRDTSRIIWYCRSAPTCTWHARASVGKGGLVRLSRLAPQAEHSCAGALDPFRPPYAKNDFLVKAIDARMSVHAQTTAKEIADVLNKGLRIKPSLPAIYKAKCSLLGGQDEELKAQVRRLPAYLAKLRAADPETIARIEPQAEEGGAAPKEFDRCFVAPAAARAAFNTCRPLVALDGTFLKGKLKYVLLLAATFDSNDSLVILSWALVKVENTANWTWFVQQLLVAMPDLNKNSTTIISDRDKGLLSAVSSVLPSAPHSFCCFHLATNIKTRYGQSVVPLFWRCVYAPTKVEFDVALTQLRERKKEAAEYLCAPEQGHDQWATYAFPGRRWGLVTSNLAEIANSLLVPIRALPLVDLLAAIYEHQQRKFFDRAKEAQQWAGAASPAATRALKLACDAGRSMSVTPASTLSGLVRDGSLAYEVHLPGSPGHALGFCSCGKFQQLMRPCSHVAAFCTALRQPPLQYLHSGYNTATWRGTYAKAYVPVSTSSLTEDNSLISPALVQKKGRPRTKRMEKGAKPAKDGKQYLCSICRDPGHTRKSCQLVHTA